MTAVLYCIVSRELHPRSGLVERPVTTPVQQLTSSEKDRASSEAAEVGEYKIACMTKQIPSVDIDRLSMSTATIVTSLIHMAEIG